MLILISGLPRAGKSSFADRLEVDHGFTHVPLDRYIKEVPDGVTFLNWVGTSDCIDWTLLNIHLDQLRSGRSCFTPMPDWKNRGKRMSQGGVEKGGRQMHPSSHGYAIAGCHAHCLPKPASAVCKIFMQAPHVVIAERIAQSPMTNRNVLEFLDRHLSPGWRAIEAYAEAADLILLGTDDPSSQITQFFSALKIG